MVRPVIVVVIVCYRVAIDYDVSAHTHHIGTIDAQGRRRHNLHSRILSIEVDGFMPGIGSGLGQTIQRVAYHEIVIARADGWFYQMALAVDKVIDAVIVWTAHTDAEILHDPLYHREIRLCDLGQVIEHITHSRLKMIIPAAGIHIAQPGFFQLAPGIVAVYDRSAHDLGGGGGGKPGVDCCLMLSHLLTKALPAQAAM